MPEALHPRLADALAELGRHERKKPNGLFWWRRASMSRLEALGLVETWRSKSLAQYRGKTLPYRLTDAGRAALATTQGRETGGGVDG